MPSVRPSLRLARAATARRLFSSTSAARWGSPRPSLVGLPIDIHPEVQAAQAEGRAIVALESTLITHGLPPPHSNTLPAECEDILRTQGVTPATITILNGRIKVGLEGSQLDELAEKGFAAKKDGGAKLWKVGRRELGAAVVKRMDGGTTVSGTMAVAHLAGIKIFSTGGIGGVHRGAETSFDISSDLISLSDTPVTVVCAGSKSILDIGLTLEYLEAHAVPVAAYKTLDWPAFYTPTSGFKAPMQLNSARQVAETIIMTDRLSLPNSLLLGVPIPEEWHAAGHALQEAVEQAVRESVENGMAKSGKRVTPWLLQRVSELTKGSSIDSNKALIKNNVKVGGEIALEHARLLKESLPSTASFQPAFPAAPSSSPSSPTPPEPTPLALPPAPLLVVGSLAIDITMHPTSVSPLRTTAPGKVSLSLGGVAGNVAGAAHSLLGGEEVMLVAPVGDDLLGSVARNGLKDRGMRSDGLVKLGESERTATCGILLDQTGELVGGVADMAIAAEMEGDQIVRRIKENRPKLVCFDGNLAEAAMGTMLKHCSAENVPTFFEPTSNAQSLKLLRAIQSTAPRNPSPPPHPYVTYSTPNIHELSTLYTHLQSLESDSPTAKLFAMDLWFDFINVPSSLLERRLPAWVVNEGVAVMAVQLLPIFGTLFVKSGSRGVLAVQRVSGAENVAEWKAEGDRKGLVVAASSQGPSEAVVIRHFEALELKEEEVKNVTGAGDNLAGAMLAGMVKGLRADRPEDLERIVKMAQRAAINTLKSAEAVGDHTELRKLLPSAREAT